MKRSIIAALAIVSACAASASAENFEGNVSVGGSYSNIKGQAAKFNEYRALGDGGQVGLDLNYRDTSFYFDASGNLSLINGKSVYDEAATSDVDLFLKMGMPDIFKVSLFYKDIPHNFTYGAKTFVDGIGTSALTKPVPGTNPTLADYTRTFNYAIKRNNYGADAEVSFKTPFFLSLRAERMETNGLMPFAVSTSLRELPVPISFATNNFYLQTGYRSDRLIATIDGTVSGFTNDNYKIATWNSTTSAGYNAYEPADNSFYRIGGNLTYRLPFWNSTFMAKASYSELQSDVLLQDSGTSGSFGTGASFRTPIQWAGRINYTTANASLTSNPVKNLNTRIFLNYLSKKNESPAGLNYTQEGTAAASVYYTDAFDYSKRNLGVDGSYKLPASTKVSVGYEHLNLHRNIRQDAPSTNDHTVFVQIKNDFYDWMSAKIKYQRLMRNSDSLYAQLYGNDPRGGVANTSAATTSNYWKVFFMPADTADKEQDAFKVGLDFEPLHGLSLGVEYAYKHDVYTKNFLGMQNANRHEVFFDTNYEVGLAKLNAYADLELVNSFSRYRQLPRTTGGSATLYADPFGFSNANNFNWTSQRKDLNYALGFKTDLDIIKDTFSVGAGYRYENANGSNDFTTNVAGINYANVSELDDYIKHTVNAKMVYNFTKSVAVELGYLYEHMKYSDDAYSGYAYIVGGNYLSGAYANPNYDASVVYTKLNFKF